MSRYAYIIVEGSHDLEFIIKILSSFYDFRLITKSENLDPYWKDLVPDTFPHKGALLQRVPVPYFLHNTNTKLAIQNAGGIDKIVNTIEENFSIIDISKLSSIGIILDCDYDKTVDEKFNLFMNKLRKLQAIDVPTSMHDFSQSIPKVGCYILPDNQRKGTLEDILLECAKHVYPSLYTGAEKFVNEVDLNSAEFVESDKEEFMKPTGRYKAVVGSIVNVLRPSKTIQVSLREDRWISETTQNLPEIQAIRLFLASLLNLPAE